MSAAELRDFPVCLQLAGRRVVVVGGGAVAAQRVRALLEVGARVDVIAPELCASLEEIVAQVRWFAREGEEGDVASSFCCFVATDDRGVSERMARACRARGVLVNSADVPELCDFTLPSVGRRGAITVAVSTAGQAPALARALRVELMRHVSRRHAELARVVGFLRGRVPAGSSRMKLLREVVDGEAGTLLLSGRRSEAFAAVRKALS